MKQVLDGTRCLGSLALPNQNRMTVPSMTAAYTCGTRVQPPISSSAGAANLFSAEPELPAP